MTPVTRILLAWAACTAEEKHRGITEYQRYQRTVVVFAQTYSVPRCVAAAILAVLSPALTWRENQESAHRVFRYEERISGYGQNVRKAQKILEAWLIYSDTSRKFDPTRFFGGPKVTAFYWLILSGGNDTDVCVDGHAFNLAMGRGRIPLKKTKGSKREFDVVREAYRLAGRVVGVQPCAIQAATWLAWRASRGFAQGRIHFPVESNDDCRSADPYRYTP